MLQWYTPVQQLHKPLSAQRKKPHNSVKSFRNIDYFCFMKKHDKILDRIVRIANLKYPDSEVYLYGSQARGDSKKYSDWDLLILLNQKNIPFEVETKIMDDFYELELETGAIMSLLVYSKSDWNERHSITPLYENIKKEGVRLK
jgi:uncharacterized protein